MEQHEIELIRRVQHGDHTAFEQLMNAYGERLMGIAYNLTKNIKDAEDLYQETFIKVYRNIQGFRFESEFFTWLYRILTNQAFNLFRKRKRMDVVDPGENDYLWETLPSEDPRPGEQELVDISVRREIDRALLQLSAKQRTVFILKHYEGKKIKDIANILDCTEGTVKRYLFRATRKLQALLVAL